MRIKRAARSLYSSINPLRAFELSRFTRELEKPFDNLSEFGPTGHACCCRKELCDVCQNCQELVVFFWV